MAIDDKHITYRRGRDEDMPEIHALIEAGDLDPRDVVPADALLAVADGKIVGINRLKRYDDGAVEIASAYVAPQCRRRGVNETLTRMLVAGSDETLYIVSDAKNTAYLAKMGFAAVAPDSPIPRSIREKVAWCRDRYEFAQPRIFAHEKK